MVGLLDIAPSLKTINIGGVDVIVCGVSAKGIAYLLEKFPEFKAMFGGGDIDPKKMMRSAPELVAAIIAAGTGTPGNHKAEEKAASLPLEMQFDLMEAILEVTMPSGAGPFVKRLTGLISSVAQAEKAASPVSPPSRSNGISEPSVGTESSTTSLPL
jgi:hypothetical protein